MANYGHDDSKSQPHLLEKTAEEESETSSGVVGLTDVLKPWKRLFHYQDLSL